ncbi:15850_t:CDS:2 [Entrophospora sp. SA101]|nr:15850_t:CDS:2 [Entrophospora sp. SA101]
MTVEYSDLSSHRNNNSINNLDGRCMIPPQFHLLGDGGYPNLQRDFGISGSDIEVSNTAIEPISSDVLDNTNLHSCLSSISKSFVQHVRGNVS